MKSFSVRPQTLAPNLRNADSREVPNSLSRISWPVASKAKQPWNITVTCFGCQVTEYFWRVSNVTLRGRNWPSRQRKNPQNILRVRISACYSAASFPLAESNRPWLRLRLAWRLVTSFQQSKSQSPLSHLLFRSRLSTSRSWSSRRLGKLLSAKSPTEYSTKLQKTTRPDHWPGICQSTPLFTGRLARKRRPL